MLPLPKLDDRTYEDIRAEAIRNITKYCPEWTNHNASDPGITIVELFSAMAEMTNYRLNRVPDKNYIAFLDMIGIIPRYPVSAKSRVLFNVVENYEFDSDKKSAIFIPKNCVLSTDDENKILFETLKEQNIFNLKIKDIFSISFDDIKNKNYITSHISKVNDNKPFVPFQQEDKEESKIAIYIASEQLVILKEHSNTTILFKLPTTIDGFNYSKEKEFLKRQEWQYYNGTWNNLKIIDMNIVVNDENCQVLQVTFDKKNNIEKKEFENFGENYYIRCLFKEVHTWYKNLALYGIDIASNNNGITPDKCYYKGLELTLENDILPFGEEPNLNSNISNDIFYIKCDEAFSKKNNNIKIEIVHSSNKKYIMPVGYNNLKIEWFYGVGNKEFKQLDVKDSTKNFTQNGSIIFNVPEDIGINNINEISGFWIKAQITSGDFGKKEERRYDEQGNQIGIKSTQTLNPPVIETIKIKFTQIDIPLDGCISYNNYNYNELKFINKNVVKIFQENFIKENALYFLFDSYISDTSLSLYFEVTNNQKINMYSKQRLIKWQILIDGKWQNIIFYDETDTLTKSGEITFIIPKIEKLETFEIDNNTKKGMWIKGVVDFSIINDALYIDNILLNTIEVVQQETIYNEYLGKSIGLPYIQLKLNYKNLVKAPLICVGESEEIYKATKRFIDHNSEDNVFRYNPITSVLEFGDNKYGKIPKLNEKIYAKEYAFTLGSKGNIPKGKITNIHTNISGIDSVTNITNAIGGKDGDDIDSIKKYAPSIFKSRDRAVTIEDYESLAKDFSSSLLDIKCINKNSHIEIIIATKELFSNNGFINKKFIYDLENFLQDKSLITVVIKVKEAKKYTFSLKATIKNSSEKILFEKDIYDKFNAIAKKYFSLENEFKIGKNVTKADFYKILNKVNHNLYFDDINILSDGQSKGNILYIAKDEVAFFDTIIIEEFKNECS